MESKIYAALGKIMSEVGAIEKGQTNTQQGFKFRGIDDFMNTLHGLFAKWKVIILPSETEAIQEPYTYTDSRGYEKIQFRSRIHFTFSFVSTEDGSSVQTDGWGEAADNGDKGYNKCKSIALKYALMQLFLVPTADIVDPDKETPEEISKKPTKKAPVKDANEKSEESIGDLLDKALKAVESATTRKELEDIYKAYRGAIGKDATFVKALNDKAKDVK